MTQFLWRAALVWGDSDRSGRAEQQTAGGKGEDVVVELEESHYEHLLLLTRFRD
jgi:hypothetical protein